MLDTERESFVFYRGFYEAMQELEDNERLELLDMICGYALFGREPKKKGAVVAIFKAVKPQIDANNKRFEDGCKGGRPKNHKKKPVVSELKTSGFENENHGFEDENQWLGENENVNVNVNENVNEHENVVVNENVHGETIGETTTTTTARPNLQQLKIWCSINGINTNIDKFYAYNDARGWTLNGKPADWQKLLQLWCANDKEHKPRSGQDKGEMQHEYDFEAIERDLVNKL